MAKKRLAKPTAATSGSPKKKAHVKPGGDAVPSASELGKVFAGKTPSRTDDPQDNAAVEMIILPYNTDGSIYNVLFQAKKLMVVHLLHRQKPNVWFRLMTNLGEYLKHRHLEDSEFPLALSELELSLKCKFVFTKGTPLDEDRHNLFVGYRCAVYVQGDVESCKDLIIFLDAYIKWRTGHDDFAKDKAASAVKINILAPKDFDMKLTASDAENVGDMDCIFEVSNDENNFHW